MPFDHDKPWGQKPPFDPDKTWEEMVEIARGLKVLDQPASSLGALVQVQNEQEAIRLYLAINTAGTPHTPEEIERVRAMLPKPSP